MIFVEGSEPIFSKPDVGQKPQALRRNRIKLHRRAPADAVAIERSRALVYRFRSGDVGGAGTRGYQL
jgi:hypothetical protein